MLNLIKKGIEKIVQECKDTKELFSHSTYTDLEYFSTKADKVVELVKEKYERPQNASEQGALEAHLAYAQKAIDSYERLRWPVIPIPIGAALAGAGSGAAYLTDNPWIFIVSAAGGIAAGIASFLCIRKTADELIERSETYMQECLLQIKELNSDNTDLAA